MTDPSSLRVELVGKALEHAARFVRAPGRIIDPVALAASMEVFVLAEGTSGVETRLRYLDMAIQRAASFRYTSRDAPDLMETAESIAAFVDRGEIRTSQERRDAR